MNKKDEEFMKIFENGRWLKYLLRIIVVCLIVRIVAVLAEIAFNGIYSETYFLEVIMYALLTLTASFLLVNTDKL